MKSLHQYYRFIVAFTQTICFHLFLIQANPTLKRLQHKGLNRHHICMSLPFVSVLSLLYQTLVPAHEGLFMKDTDLLSSTLERPTMLLCQTTTKTNL